jgi:hypothetical protein
MHLAHLNLDELVTWLRSGEVCQVLGEDGGEIGAGGDHLDDGGRMAADGPPPERLRWCRGRRPPDRLGMAQVVDADSDVDGDDSDALSEGGSSSASRNSSAFLSEGDEDEDECDDGVMGDEGRCSIMGLLALGDADLDALDEGALRGHLKVLRKELTWATRAGRCAAASIHWATPSDGPCVSTACRSAAAEAADMGVLANVATCSARALGASSAIRGGHLTLPMRTLRGNSTTAPGTWLPRRVRRCHAASASSTALSPREPCIKP